MYELGASECLLMEFLRSLRFSEGFIFRPAVNTSMPLRKLSRTEHSSPKSASSPVFRDVEDAVDRSHIRVSSGSAVVLGLINGRLNAEPTTAYLLTFSGGKCTANCGFCSQARSSQSRANLLSRVVWPVFPTGDVLDKLASSADKGNIKRICIQALNYPSVLDDVVALVKQIKMRGLRTPISVSCQPLSRAEVERLAEAGVERMSIPLDAATKHVFDRVKGHLAEGPYDWYTQKDALLKAVEVLGKAKVSTHLIVGLGESEKDMVQTIQWCVDKGIHPALFSFTPIRGTALETNCPPHINRYRRVQLARYLINERKTRFEKMSFTAEEERIANFGVPQDQLTKAIQLGIPFVTSGCPNCNRPYYNEKPSGPVYNFPTQPTPQEIEEIKSQFEIEREP